MYWYLFLVLILIAGVAYYLAEKNKNLFYLQIATILMIVIGIMLASTGLDIPIGWAIF